MSDPFISDRLNERGRATSNGQRTRVSTPVPPKTRRATCRCTSPRCLASRSPAKVLHWTQLNDDQEYVLDLMQLPDGSRYLQPREVGDLRTPHTVFSTVPASGTALRDTATGQHGVKLENGESFAVDAHGVWMTLAEYKQIAGDRSRPQENGPWVNGICRLNCHRNRHLNPHSESLAGRGEGSY